jgi:outer membrane protein assembly factor BamA
MYLRAVRQVVVLALAWWFLGAGSGHAQNSSSHYFCCPPSAFCDPVMKARSGSARPQNYIDTKYYVDSVAFDGPVDLTGSELQQVVTLLKETEFDRLPNWLERVQDALRQPWLDHGYYKVEVIAKAAPVGGDDGRYAITAHVDEGLQYRVGSIDFSAENSDYVENSDSPDKPSLHRLPAYTDGSGFANSEKRPVFPPDELRSLMPLRDGDIFDNRKIRDGLNALNEFYGQHGYLNFVAEPITHIDDKHQIISLRINVDEGRQFHIGKIEVQGLEPSIRHSLIWNIKTGDAFNVKAVQKFFDDNKPNFPVGSYWGSDPQIVRNMKTSTVDINLTFLSCPDR